MLEPTKARIAGPPDAATDRTALISTMVKSQSNPYSTDTNCIVWFPAIVWQPFG